MYLFMLIILNILSYTLKLHKIKRNVTPLFDKYIYRRIKIVKSN